MVKKVIIPVGEDEFLLYNPFTQIVDIIDGDIVEGLSQGTLPEEVVSLLKRHGHITEESASECEQKAYNDYKKAYARLSTGTHYYVIPTYNCTMRCIYCYQKDLRTEKKLISKKALAQFFNIVENNPPKRVTLYGGEPLQKMTKPVVDPIIDFCTSMGYNLFACTNGLSLQEFSLEAFSRITVTLDGLSPVQNVRRPAVSKESFKTVVKNIEYTINMGVPLTLSINVDSQNMDELPQFADFLISKGWHNNANVAFELSHIMQSLDKEYSIVEPLEAAIKMVNLYKEYPQMEIFLPSLKELTPLLQVFFKEQEWRPKYWYCGANCYMQFYDPYGYIYPCYMVIGRPQFAIGKYYPAQEWFPHKEVWRERNCFTLPQCRECSFNYFCGGGCLYRQYIRTHSLTGAYCDLLKAAVSYVPFLYNLVKQRGERL